MNFAVAGATLALIIPAELPDKTFIASIILSSRYRALPVWIGAASGLIVQAGIGVIAGRLLAYLPHRWVQVIVAVLFFAGAAYLLFISERSAMEEGGRVADKKEGDLASRSSGVRVALTTFGIVTLAEFGDLTQVLIANLSARFRDPLSVFAGAAIGFLIVSGVGVAAGRTITRVMPLAVLRRVSGLALVGLGIWTAVGAAS